MDSTIHKQVGLGYVRKLAELEPMKKSANSVPPWVLSQVPPMTSLNDVR